jgi:hypothetical protein
MERSGRSRGRAFRRGAIGTFFLLAQAGCGNTSPSTGNTTPQAAGATAQPAFARSVLLMPVTGVVRVAVRPAGFVRLVNARVVPVGTLVDTNAGTVALTSALPTGKRLQTGRFHGGVFEIRQDRAQAGLTNLVLRDNLSRRTACAPRARSSQRVLGLLRGNASGRFRTTGRFAAATVRGTDWGVRDRCDGTLTVVRTGTVAVRDLRTGKTVIVHAGQTNLAPAP